jgi:hypothetical protein
MKVFRTNSKERSSQLKKNAKRFAAYSAAAAATVTSANISVNAAEVIHDIPDQTAGFTSNVLFNVQTGVLSTAPLGIYAYYHTNDASFALNANSWGEIMYAPIGDTALPNPAGLVGTGGFTSVTGSYGWRYASRLSLSSTIGPGKSFNGNSAWSSLGNYDYLSQFNDGTIGIVGLRFHIGSELHYGWAEVTLPASGGAVLHGFGYNNSPNAPTHPMSTTRDILGDFNDDKVLDAVDWVTMRDNGFATSQSYEDGDMNGDGNIDIDDFDLFRFSYEEENPGSGAFEAMVAATAIPEPSSMMLLAAGAAGLGAWRKRRTQ